MSEKAGLNRRRFLTVATSVTGGIGLAFTAAPFLASFKPSARAQALGAPVEVDISKLDAGAMVRVKWRGQPVWVLRRTESMLASLDKVAGKLADPGSEESIQPGYAANEYRSIRPEILVVVGNCTHLGCAPLDQFEVKPMPYDPDWQGGFFCPCHGSKFDLAGRVYASVPAPTNLVVPPYRFAGESLIIIGDDTGLAAGGNA